MRFDDVGLFGRRELGPCATIGRVPLAGLELGDQLADRAGTACAAIGSFRIDVVPRVEDAREDPLRPAVVRRVDGLDRATAVVAKSQPALLFTEAGDVGGRGDRRVLAGLDGVLLGRQTECVETHRVEHVAAGHALVARIDVGTGVAEHVSHVQPVPGGVGEHVVDIELFARCIGSGGVGQRAYRVGCVKRAVSIPVVLPPALDLCGEHGGVPERGNVVDCRLSGGGGRVRCVAGGLSRHSEDPG